MIERLRLKNFTAFKELDMEFAPGVNLIIGANGTGKTHILKAMYAYLRGAVDYGILKKFADVFLPYGGDISRLKYQRRQNNQTLVHIDGFNRGEGGRLEHPAARMILEHDMLEEDMGRLAYIPVKEMLANAPGFLSLYELRKIHFESLSRDVLINAYLPPLRQLFPVLLSLMARLESLIGGTVIVKNETFFLKNKQGELEFDLLAEGLRKLGLLWLLIQNGCLSKGSVLFWDEPEANLNPELLEPLVDILLELQRLGVQMFLATHDYALLKLFDLKKTNDDKVRFFSLEKDKEKGVKYTASDGYIGTLPNPISKAYDSLFKLDIETGLKGLLS